MILWWLFFVPFSESLSIFYDKGFKLLRRTPDEGLHMLYRVSSRGSYLVDEKVFFRIPSTLFAMDDALQTWLCVFRSLLISIPRQRSIFFRFKRVHSRFKKGYWNIYEPLFLEVMTDRYLVMYEVMFE